MSEKKKHVIIIGGGFAGVNAAKILGKHDLYQVTLIDRHNFHLFQPLLYQVAMAALSPAEIAYPIRTMVRKYKNIDVLLDDVVDVRPKQRLLITKTRSMRYDYVIMACGATHSYFGNNNWEAYAPGLKTLGQATEIRRRVLLAFEKAAREKDPVKRQKYLTFVVVGGGPTGVELAGSIAEMSHQSLRKDFRNLDISKTRVILVEGGPGILNSYSEKLSSRAVSDLEKLGVQVRTNAMVTHIEKNGVSIGEDEFIKSCTVLWAAGVAASELNEKLGVPLDPSGRIIVGKHCEVEAFPEIFVTGDQAHYKPPGGEALPGLAPVAVQQGKYVAKHLNRMAQGEKLPEFKYLDKGQMATIGRNRAILEAFGIKMGGIAAWFAWLFIHILYLAGFRNRAFVLIQWFWSYLTFRKGARLIIDKEWRTHSLLDDDT